MRNFLNVVNNNKKIIICIILAPIIVFILSVVLTAIFNFGTYFGTFIRNLYSLVVC
jgi:hypothetical protein